MDKRAVTPQEKRAVIEQIYAAWLATDHLRFGQLVCNLTPSKDVFYAEDSEIIEGIKPFLDKIGKGS